MGKYLTGLMAAAMLGCASQQQPPTPPTPTSGASLQKPRPTFLTHEELKALLSETLTVHAAGFGLRGTAIYMKDGTARFEGRTVFVGSWRIDGNKFCTRTTQMGDGCSNVEKTGSRNYKLYPTDGQDGSTWEVLK